MKRLLFSAIVALFGIIGAQAQDRSAYSFKVTPHVNQEDELIDSITVDVLVDGVKTYLDFSTTLFTPQSPDINHQWIVERDINFDGVPDLMIFYGYIGYGGQGGDIYHGYVWDVKTRKFRLEENFSEIPDPQFDETEKTIRADYRNDYSTFVHVVYKWVDGYLNLFTQSEEELEEPEAGF